MCWFKKARPVTPRNEVEGHMRGQRELKPLFTSDHAMLRPPFGNGGVPAFTGWPTSTTCARYALTEAPAKRIATPPPTFAFVFPIPPTSTSPQPGVTSSPRIQGGHHADRVSAPQLAQARATPGKQRIPTQGVRLNNQSLNNWGSSQPRRSALQSSWPTRTRGPTELIGRKTAEVKPAAHPNSSRGITCTHSASMTAFPSQRR